VNSDRIEIQRIRLSRLRRAHRVAPYRFPRQQRDIFRAIRLIRSRAAEWGVNPDRSRCSASRPAANLTASAGTLFEEVNADRGRRAARLPRSARTRSSPVIR
jgi:hypothetical protein